MKKALWLLSATALPIVLSAGEPAAEKKRVPTAEEIRARYSPEKLEKLRASLAARIAVYDQAEQGRRAPTAEEAAALAPAAASTADAAPAVRSDARGGLAIKADKAALEYVVATVDTDGATVQSHRTAPAPKEANRNEKR